MLRNLLAKKDNDEGFTLIELLVVILIIGILAAIALPTFLGQSDKAKDSSAKSDARNAISQVESCLTDADTTAAVAACNTYTGKPSTVTISAISSGTAPNSSTYTVVATSKSANSFTIVKGSDGTYTRSCSTTSKGSCPASGSW